MSTSSVDVFIVKRLIFDFISADGNCLLNDVAAQYKERLFPTGIHKRYFFSQRTDSALIASKRMIFHS